MVVVRVIDGGDDSMNEREIGGAGGPGGGGGGGVEQTDKCDAAVVRLTDASLPYPHTHRRWNAAAHHMLLLRLLWLLAVPTHLLVPTLRVAAAAASIIHPSFLLLLLLLLHSCVCVCSPTYACCTHTATHAPPSAPCIRPS